MLLLPDRLPLMLRRLELTQTRELKSLTTQLRRPPSERPRNLLLASMRRHIYRLRSCPSNPGPKGGSPQQSSHSNRFLSFLRLKDSAMPPTTVSGTLKILQSLPELTG